MARILLLDFDGVIHSYTSGWKGAAVIPDPPVHDDGKGIDGHGAIAWINKLVNHLDDNGEPVFRVMIYSSRSKEPAGVTAMRAWLEDYGLPFSTITALEFPTQKPPAFLTIDDRALRFQGRFFGPDELEEFIPWRSGDRILHP